MQAVILAAGRGARLHPLTTRRSKAMLPVLGKPMVARVMESLAANGLRDFILVTSPDDAEIKPYFQAPEARGAIPLSAQIQFASQPQRLGMADALRCAASLIQEDFILSACDSLIPAEQITRLLEAWRSPHKPQAVLAIMPVPLEEVRSTGIVALEDMWVKRIIEKPTIEQAPSRLASLPLYIFSPAILEYLPEVKLSPRGEFELQDAIQLLIERQGRTLGVRVDQRLTLTRPIDLLNINRYYLDKLSPTIDNQSDRIGRNVELIPPVYIGPDAQIENNCQIGPSVYIEGYCQIHAGACLQEAVILRGGVIPENTVIKQQVIG